MKARRFPYQNLSHSMSDSSVLNRFSSMWLRYIAQVLWRWALRRFLYLCLFILCLRLRRTLSARHTMAPLFSVQCSAHSAEPPLAASRHASLDLCSSSSWPTVSGMRAGDAAVEAAVGSLASAAAVWSTPRHLGKGLPAQRTASTAAAASSSCAAGYCRSYCAETLPVEEPCSTADAYCASVEPTSTINVR